MSKALDLANDLSSFELKYDAGTIDAVIITNSVVDAGQLLGIDLSGIANAGDPISVNVSNAQDGEVLTFSSGVLVNQTVSVNSSSIDHDALTNFVANEHIDWTSTTENFSTTGTFSSGAGTIVNDSTASDTLILQSSEDSSSAAPILSFDRNSASAASADYLGQIKFKGNNDASSEQIYAKITGKISDPTSGSEDGLIEYAVKNAGSNKIVMRVTGSALKLLNTTDLEVDGNIDTGGTQRISSAGALSNVTAAASIITTGTFADARIAQSNVTQHQGTLSIAESQITFASSFIELGDLSASTAAAGTTGLAYNNGTGAFTYTPPDLSSYALSANVPSVLNDLTDVTVSGNEASGETLVSDGSGGFSFDPLTPLMLSIALG